MIWQPSTAVRRSWPFEGTEIVTSPGPASRPAYSGLNSTSSHTMSPDPHDNCFPHLIHTHGSIFLGSREPETQHIHAPFADRFRTIPRRGWLRSLLLPNRTKTPDDTRSCSSLNVDVPVVCWLGSVISGIRSHPSSAKNTDLVSFSCPQS